MVDHERVYEEIQDAAAAALTAHVIGMLRVDQEVLFAPLADIRAVLADLARSDPRVTIEVTDAASAIEPAPTCPPPCTD